MPLSPILIPPSATFWCDAARALLRRLQEDALLPQRTPSQAPDFSALCVMVPTYGHALQLKAALAEALQCAFIPPRITTPATWLELLPPESGGSAIAHDSERLMALYAGLRQHAWLKKLFTAKRNTDLLPLAQTLLSLSDELTQALLPALQLAPEALEQSWQAALAELSPPARQLLSDETQLVWTIWQSQLEQNDASAARMLQLQRFAEQARGPLVWISPVAPDPQQAAFLSAYAARQPVLPLLLDWRTSAISKEYAVAWHEIHAENDASQSSIFSGRQPVALYGASGLEDEALHAAQTIVDWLQQGKSRLAIVAQDRVVARRIRALLERAQVFVSDETGWKLSTTRAAAALAAWFEVVSSRAETAALLDFLKSPYVFAPLADKPAQLMTIERTLRRANVLAGWDAAGAALAGSPTEQASVRRIAQQAAAFGGRKTLAAWLAATGGMLAALDMQAALAADAAGQQVLAVLEALQAECAALTETFAFAEWRAFLDMQLEAAPFVAANLDARVVMLPLNGTRLRSFDAVLLVGADAKHLPSQPQETLFFANAVRRELGLETRESRQRQQLRDFAELLSANPEVVLSWQAHTDGEPNPLSPWIERLQLTLARHGLPPLPAHHSALATRQLQPALPRMPAPSAPQLAPQKLSASGYNSLLACPYQFFAARMLRLSALDELSDMPEKRDYGGWLHAILKTYHDTLRDQPCPLPGRENLLRSISAQAFDAILGKNAAALGYYTRWQKVIPAYLEWANAHEAEGWQFVVGEQWFEKTLRWQQGEIQGEVLLQGRIDRIDEAADGARAILDYKTSDAASLKARLKGGEDLQLPFYGMLSDAPVASAQYVALEADKGKGGKTGAAAAPDYANWKTALETHIVMNMQAIAGGTPLPANGVESVCQYCDVRGLCRKGAW
ncbi:PD-(D/E)XK nuclease family protein [Herminiimonas sp. CN]|uniref:PD-(D/E)XK nuclease family protein n=1 Tax=Herminiimonas sp. CN TaxID=1349818 RepID=UPI000473A121|nr:PD-(D/E)XK nuclease family protein [Herminiimonas sp. CN]